MVPLDSFLPIIRRQISGPLDFMMTDAALEAAITFCRESMLIRYPFLLEGIVAGQPYTIIDLPAGLRPFKILALNDLTDERPEATLSYCGYPELTSGVDYELTDGNIYTFRQAYSKVRVLLAFTPTYDATEVPDVLLNDYSKTIACGALEQLYIMPGKPWTDEQRSSYYKARFTDGFRDAFRVAIERSPQTGFHNPVRRHEFF